MDIGTVFCERTHAEEIQGHTVIFNQSEFVSDLLRCIGEKWKGKTSLVLFQCPLHFKVIISLTIGCELYSLIFGETHNISSNGEVGGVSGSVWDGQRDSKMVKCITFSVLRKKSGRLSVIMFMTLVWYFFSNTIS